jgi:hypothetical protein
MVLLKTDINGSLGNIHDIFYRQEASETPRTRLQGGLGVITY